MKVSLAALRINATPATIRPALKGAIIGQSRRKVCHVERSLSLCILASVFSSTGTGGGQEQTITSTWTTLAHHGMVIVPIGYGAQELFDISQVRGGTPYGATTIAGGDGSRQPSNEELSIARYQGEYVSGLAKKLNG